MSEAVGANKAKRLSLLTGVSVLAAAVASLTSPASAQSAAPNAGGSSNAEPQGGDEAIVVTGTRLVRQDFEAISPVLTVTADSLELTGTLTPDTLLNQLPQLVPGNTRTSNNSGGFPFATLDLRGLGPNRTLVLVNGERVPASSTSGVVNINTIPGSLISRIETVTGGASAVYGSDAMSGIVNFVLKDDYEGGEVGATYGSELATGNVGDFEAHGLIGGNFANGRGNLTAYGSYYNRAGVFQSEYDWSRVAGAVFYDAATHRAVVVDSLAQANAILAGGGTRLLSGGSGTPAWGWITNDPSNPFSGLGSNAATPLFHAGATDTNCDGVAGGAVDSADLSFNQSGDLTPRNNSGACRVPERMSTAPGGSSRYNYAPDNYIIIPEEREAMTTTGRYDVNDNIRLSVLMNYINDRTVTQLAPSPATGLTVTLTPTMRNYIATNHADLWAALQSRAQPYAPFVEDRRTNELGARVAFTENSGFFLISSLDGSLGDSWDWNLSASYGRSSFLSRLNNSANRTGLAQGLAGCKTTLPGPDGVLNTADDTEENLAGALPNCAIVDIFGADTMSSDAVNFLRTPIFSETLVEQQRVSGFLRGDLVSLPAGPVSTVFGFEYRDDSAEFHVDNEQRLGNIYGFNALQDQSGQIDVYELYTEFSVPLISEQPFAYYVGLEGGYRISNYSSSAGNVETWKLGGEWAPAQWLRFRGIYNVATRAPSVFELVQAGDQGFPGYVDPCNDGAGNNANCLAAPGSSAIPAAVYPGFAQNNTQVQSFAFGNANLRPETADTYTIGVVFQPDWFPVGDLRATVDYYHINIADAIAPQSVQSYLNRCYASPADAAACARIVRDTATGQVVSINTSTGNINALATNGWDIQLEWRVPVGPGELTISELYSIIDSYKISGVEYVGTDGGSPGTGIFDAKSVLSITYAVGDWTLFGHWSYVPPLRDTAAGLFGVTQDTPAASYVDVSARWAVTDNLSITGVVNNLFDDAPPETPAGVLGGQANVDPQLYRVTGRSFSVTGRLRF